MGLLIVPASGHLSDFKNHYFEWNFNHRFKVCLLRVVSNFMWTCEGTFFLTNIQISLKLFRNFLLCSKHRVISMERFFNHKRNKNNCSETSIVGQTPSKCFSDQNKFHLRDTFSHYSIALREMWQECRWKYYLNLKDKKLRFIPKRLKINGSDVVLFIYWWWCYTILFLFRWTLFL